MFSNLGDLLSGGPTSPIIQYGLISISVLILLSVVVDRILGVKPLDAEPHFLPPGIPYFGHIVGIIRKGVDYYDELTQVPFP